MAAASFARRPQQGIVPPKKVPRWASKFSPLQGILKQPFQPCVGWNYRMAFPLSNTVCHRSYPNHVSDYMTMLGGSHTTLMPQMTSCCHNCRSIYQMSQCIGPEYVEIIVSCEGGVNVTDLIANIFALSASEN